MGGRPSLQSAPLAAAVQHRTNRASHVRPRLRTHSNRQTSKVARSDSQPCLTAATLTVFACSPRSPQLQTAIPRGKATSGLHCTPHV